MIKFSFQIKRIYIHFINLHQNSLITVVKSCEKVLRLNMTSTTKVKEEKFQSYNKTVIGFNFSRHEDLSSLKSDIHLGLGALV